MEFRAKVRTCLWFADEAEDAINFYVSIIPGSGIDNIVRPDPDKPALAIEFTLGGTPMMTLAGNPGFEFSNAASISVLAEDQAETDHLWDALTADGGKPGMCGWLNDRFGVAWQIVPKALPRLMASDDKEATARVQSAMMTMTRIDVAALENAFSNGSA